MSNEVYANGMEISCKAADGKSISAFPDVCFTPPQTLATPPGIPIPYPNTGMASDTTNGSTSVNISDKEITLKNKSYFKKSTGDEAGCAPKKGVVTSTNTGKVYFNAWSMDVMIEGENVVRHLDLTTHNHNPPPGQTPPWPFLAKQTVTKETGPCATDIKKEKAACGNCEPYGTGNSCKDSKCQAARKCSLSPYGGKGSPNCCKPQVAHHLLPNSLLQSVRPHSSSNVRGLKKTGPNAYTEPGAPCVCCSGKKGVKNPIGTHKKMHDITKKKLKAILTTGQTLTYQDAVSKSAEAHEETFRTTGPKGGGPQCQKECIEAQISAYMENCRSGATIEVRQVDGATNAKYDKYKRGKAK